MFVRLLVIKVSPSVPELNDSLVPPATVVADVNSILVPFVVSKVSEVAVIILTSVSRFALPRRIVLDGVVNELFEIVTRFWVSSRSSPPAK